MRTMISPTPSSSARRPAGKRGVGPNKTGTLVLVGPEIRACRVHDGLDAPLGQGLNGRLAEVGVRINQKLQRRPRACFGLFEEPDDRCKSLDEIRLFSSRHELNPRQDKL